MEENTVRSLLSHHPSPSLNLISFPSHQHQPLCSARLVADPCGSVISAVTVGREQDRLSPAPAALPLAETNPETVSSVCNGLTCPVENNPSVPIKTPSAISLLLYIPVGKSFLFSSDMDAKTIFQFSCLKQQNVKNVDFHRYCNSKTKLLCY